MPDCNHSVASGIQQVYEHNKRVEIMDRVFECGARVLGTALLILTIPAQGSINKDIRVEAGSAADGATSVNGSILVGDSASVSGKLTTVNGSIDVGRDATIKNAGTVNGSIQVGSNTSTEDLETVNGAIEIADNVKVNGEVSAVNGRIRVAANGSVARSLSNVNGQIELSGSRVAGDVSTVSGNVELSDGASIGGDLVIEESRGFTRGNRDARKPKVIIGPGSRVDGVIRAEREIDLYISDRAQVGGVEGKLSMADAVRFSGNRP